MLKSKQESKTALNPKTVLLCSDNMVIVFDEAGNQMKKFQGIYKQAVTALRTADLKGCEFIRSNWLKRSQQDMTREEFFNLNPSDLIATN